MKKANSSFVQRALPQQLCSTSAAVGATRELDKCNDGEEEGGRGQAGDPERRRAARRLRRHLRLRAAAASETLDLRAPTRAARSQMTGLAVGAVDTYRLVKAGGRTVDQSRIARLAFHEMGRSGLVVSVFFALYQVCKCGIAAAGIEAPEVKVGGATAASLAPLSVLPATRRLSPYCLTLVAVDSYHTYFAPDSR